LQDQIRNGVELLDSKNGRNFDATSERIAASLMALAKDAGLDRVDHVLLSVETRELPAAHSIFIVKGELSDPSAQRAAMTTSEAALKPIEQSHADLERINQRHLAASDLVQPREQEMIHSAPSMSR
jgi:hypothetical protein